MMNNKRVIFLSLVLLLIVFSCQKREMELELVDTPPTAVIPEESIPDEIIEDAEGKPVLSLLPTDTVKILVREDGAPGMYLGEDGDVHGFYVDLERMVMEEMGQVYQFVPYSDVGPVIQGIKSGIYHLALAVPDLPDYRSFVYLSIPYEILHYVTFVQEGNTEITGATREELIKNLYGKKVGVQTQGHIYQALRDLKEIDLIEYPTTTKALEDLDKGNLDAVPDVKRIGLYYAARENWNIVPVGESIINHRITTGMSKVIDASLLDRYNKALKKIIIDGRLERLYSSYFGHMDDNSRPDIY